MTNRILDVRLDPLDRPAAIEHLLRSVVEGTPLRIATINLDVIRLARRNRRLARVLESADLALCDGKILQRVGQLGDARLPEQITGHDLVEASCALAAETGKRVLLLGASPMVAVRAAQALAARFPGLVVAGEYGGRFDESGTSDRAVVLEQRIRVFAPTLVFVGLGCPKQELWLAKNQRRLGIPVGVGVGSVLDVLAGDLPRAPRWMQVGALASLFQVLAAPRRYFERYVLCDPPVLAAALVEALQRRVSWSRGVLLQERARSRARPRAPG